MFSVFAIFQDELEARKLLKVFFLQPKLYLDMSEGFSKFCKLMLNLTLRQIILSGILQTCTN